MPPYPGRKASTASPETPKSGKTKALSRPAVAWSGVPGPSGTWMVISRLAPRAAAATRKGSQGKNREHRGERTKGSFSSPHSPEWTGPQRWRCGTGGHTPSRGSRVPAQPCHQGEKGHIRGKGEQEAQTRWWGRAGPPATSSDVLLSQPFDARSPGLSGPLASPRRAAMTTAFSRDKTPALVYSLLPASARQPSSGTLSLSCS